MEEACSGIRSLTACLFAGSFLAAVYLKPFWKKLTLISMALILAILTNLFRSGFLTLWAYLYGAEAINDHWVLPIFGDIGSVRRDGIGSFSPYDNRPFCYCSPF